MENFFRKGRDPSSARSSSAHFSSSVSSRRTSGDLEGGRRITSLTSFPFEPGSREDRGRSLDELFKNGEYGAMTMLNRSSGATGVTALNEVG